VLLACLFDFLLVVECCRLFCDGFVVRFWFNWC